MSNRKGFREAISIAEKIVEQEITLADPKLVQVIGKGAEEILKRYMKKAKKLPLALQLLPQARVIVRLENEKEKNLDKTLLGDLLSILPYSVNLQEGEIPEITSLEAMIANSMAVLKVGLKTKNFDITVKALGELLYHVRGDILDGDFPAVPKYHRPQEPKPTRVVKRNVSPTIH